MMLLRCVAVWGVRFGAGVVAGVVLHYALYRISNAHPTVRLPGVLTPGAGCSFVPARNLVAFARRPATIYAVGLRITSSHSEAQ